MQELEVLRQIADQLAGLDLHKTIGYAVAFAGLVLVWLAIKWTGKAVAAVARGGWRLVKWLTAKPEPSQLCKDIMARLVGQSRLANDAEYLVAGCVACKIYPISGGLISVKVNGKGVDELLSERDREILNEIVCGVVAKHRAEARRVAIAQAREKINSV